MRCIVLSLTDDQNGDLFEELRRNNMRLIQQDDDSDDDEVRVDAWLFILPFASFLDSPNSQLTAACFGSCCLFYKGYLAGRLGA